MKRNVERDGNLTFTVCQGVAHTLAHSECVCQGVGNLSLASLKKFYMNVRLSLIENEGE